MTDTTLDSSVEKLKAREEALRRKEKEVAKREEQMKEQLEQIRNMRASMDASLQELEARELVMTDAEAKHGSLLQREEGITRRERDVDSKEETLRERLIEAAKREQESAEHFKQRQREYEEKLFPLAAREQELVRREMEAQAMDHDLELKYKQLNKHIAAEEEKEKVRDKSFRDREQALRDQMAVTERKQQELDQLNIHLTEKQRLLKAEQVENDGRDREIKWREEQLRILQTELSDLKTKLIKWESKLSTDDEAIRLEQSKVSLKVATLELKETELVEKTSRLLSMDEDIQKRDLRIQAMQREVEETYRRLEGDRSMMETSKAQLASQTLAVTEAEARARQRDQLLQAQETKLRNQAKALQEKEKSIKCWIMELQFREEQMQHHKGGASGSGFSANEIAQSSLEAVQDRYLTMSATASKKGASSQLSTRSGMSSKLMPLMPLSRESPQQAAVSESSLAECADTVSWESRRAQLEDVAEAYLAYLYGMGDDERQAANMTPSDEEQVKSLQSRHREMTSELQFLWQVLVGKPAPKLASTATAAKLAKELAGFGVGFSNSDWAQYYEHCRSEALRRRQDVIAQCVSKLAEVVDLFDRKIGRDAIEAARRAKENLKQMSGASRIHRRELGKALPMGRAVPPSTVLSGLSTPDPEVEVQTPERKTTPASHSGEEHSKPSRAGDTTTQLIATLPDYLRHHYE